MLYSAEAISHAWPMAPRTLCSMLSISARTIFFRSLPSVSQSPRRSQLYWSHLNDLQIETQRASQAGALFTRGDMSVTLVRPAVRLPQIVSGLTMLLNGRPEDHPELLQSLQNRLVVQQAQKRAKVQMHHHHRRRRRMHHLERSARVGRCLLTLPHPLRLSSY